MEWHLDYYVRYSIEVFSKVKVFLFSGLGADERVFSRFRGNDRVEFIALTWIDVGKSKTLGDYAELLIEHYHLAEYAEKEPIAVGGVSMGGMIAQEIAARIPVSSMVLISTVRSRSEIPYVLKAAHAVHIGPLLRKPFLKFIAAAGDRLTRKSGKGRNLFYEMLQNSDARLLHFGATAILAWHPPICDIPSIRFHGNRDLVFPHSSIPNCHIVEGGNHFMVFEKGERISKLIAEHLAEI